MERFLIRTMNRRTDLRRTSLGWRFYRNGHCWKIPSLEQLW